MSLDYAILGFLSEGDHSGYDLKTRCFDKEARHFWVADQAQVYRTLDRLERTKLVTARAIRQSGKPDRKVYTLTASGHTSLLEWLSASHDGPPHRDPFLLQLRFGSGISAAALVSVMDSERDARQQRLEDLRVQRTNYLKPTTAPTRRDDLVRMTIEAALSRERAAIDWIDDCIEALHAEDDSATEGPRT